MDPSRNQNFLPNYGFPNPQNPNIQPPNPNTQLPENPINSGMHPNFQMPYMMPPNFGMQYPYNHPYMPYGYPPFPGNTNVSPNMNYPNSQPFNEPTGFSNGSTDTPQFCTQMSLENDGGDTPILQPTQQSAKKKASYTTWSSEDNKALLNGYFHFSTVILEVVASYDLWIWHAFFGLPSTLNDINVLDRSPVFDDIISGEAPEVNFIVNGRQYNMAYYLADGIYPKWPVFVQSIQVLVGDKAQLFAKQQESCRKDVERAFGVLQARFAIVRQSSRMWDIEVLGIIMRACIILHNMIVEDERDTYSRNWENIDFEPSNNSASNSSINVDTQILPQFEVHVQGRSESDIHVRANLRDRSQHIQLKKNIVEHIWQKFGATLS